MTPYWKAQQVYANEPCKRTFAHDLDLHLAHGFVFSTPEFFIMGRPVDKRGDPAKIVDPTVQWPKEQCNCWHVYLMAGDPTKAWSIMPWPLGWFSFERNNDLRFYVAERIRRLSLGALDEHEVATPA